MKIININKNNFKIPPYSLKKNNSFNFDMNPNRHALKDQYIR